MPVNISRPNWSANQSLCPPGYWLCLSCAVEVFCYNIKVNICPSCCARNGVFTQFPYGPSIPHIGDSSHAAWHPVPGNSYSIWTAAPDVPLPPQSVHTGDDVAHSAYQGSELGYGSSAPATTSPVQAVVAEPPPASFPHKLSEHVNPCFNCKTQEHTAHNTYERPCTTTSSLIVGGTDQGVKLERRDHKTLPRLSIPAAPVPADPVSTEPVPYPKYNWADMRPISPLRDWHKRIKKNRTNLRGGHFHKCHSEKFRHHEHRYSKVVHPPMLRQRAYSVGTQAFATRADLQRAHEIEMRRRRKQSWRRDCQRAVGRRAAFADELMLSGNTSLDFPRSTSPSTEQEFTLVSLELSWPNPHGLPLPDRIGNYLLTHSVNVIKQELNISTLTMDSFPLRPRTNQSTLDTYSRLGYLSLPVSQHRLFPRPPACEARDITNQRSQLSSATEPGFELDETWRESGWSHSNLLENRSWKRA